MIETLKRVGLVLCLVLVGLPASAAASERAAAEALFEEGVRAAEAGDFEQACEKFEASNRLDSAPGTILNLADCKEQLGAVASAWQRYREAADRFGDSDERAAYADRRADELEARLPRVTVEVEGPVDDAVLTRNGTPLPNTVVGVSLPVDPGQHEYRIEVPGREPGVQRVAIAEGETRTVTLVPGPAVAVGEAGESSGSMSLVDDGDPVDDERGPTRSASGTRRILGWTGVGVGVAGLAVGSVTGVMTLARADEISACRDDFCPTERGVDAAQEGRVLSTVSTVAFAVGAAAATAGVVILLTAPKGEQSQLGEPRLALGLAPRPGGALLSLGGSL